MLSGNNSIIYSIITLKYRKTPLVDLQDTFLRLFEIILK